MSQLTDNLNQIVSIKSEIKDAIEAKGVDMTGVSFPDYPDKIGEIQAGGGDLTQQDVTEANFTWSVINNMASFAASYIFQYNSYIQKVNLPECEIVHYAAFTRCSNISEISLPFCKAVYGNAFSYCTSLKSVYLPECSVVLDYVFAYCSSISRVSLPKCLSIGYGTFSNCTSLSEISLPVCSYIKENTFTNTILSEVYLPSCTYIGPHVFSICTLLEHVDLPVCNNIGSYCFNTCSSLSITSLPYVKYVNQYAFQKCSSLSEISIPRCENIGNYAFVGCSSLSQVTIGLETYIVASFGNNCFSGTPLVSGVGSIYVPACNYDRYVVANGWSSLSARIVGVGDPSDYLLSYDDGLVYGRTNYLGSNFFNALGVASSSVISVHLSACDDFWIADYQSSSPFYNCPNLKSVELEACTNVNSCMFRWDNSLLEYVSLPNCLNISVSAFGYKSKLKEVYIPECKSIGLYAFQSCSSLSSIDLPACEYIENFAFDGCSSLSSMNLPVCEYIGNGAFNTCSSLSQISIPLCEYIGMNAFYYCSVLRELSAPNCSYVGYQAFWSCYRLSTVYLPACEGISSRAFYGCSSLTNVYLSKCSFIEDYAFVNCSLLKEITVEYSGVCSISNNTLNGINLQYIYVPESLVSDYKVAQYWSSMSDKIYPILSDLEFSNGLVYGWATSLNSGYLNELGISAGDVTGVSMSKLTSVASSTFMNHQNLVSVDIPLVVEYPDDLFNNTGFSEFSISVSTLGNRVFANCSGLENVTIDYDGIITAGSNLFQNCPNLSQIGVPYNLYNDYLTAPGWSEYSSLMYQEVPLLAFSNGLVFGRTTTIDSTYRQTLGITSNQVVSVSLPNCVSVGYMTFLECHSLKDVYLPNCEYLSYGAFYGANYMNGIDLPKCSFIGDYAFYWCNYSMSYIKLGYSGVCTLDGTQVFYQTPALRSIYVPASLVSDYKVAPNWSSMSTKILPIPE